MLGFLDLWSKGAYAAEHVALLGEMAPALTLAFADAPGSHLQRRGRCPSQSMAGPGVLLLRDDLSIVGQTGASQQ